MIQSQLLHSIFPSKIAGFALFGKDAVSKDFVEPCMIFSAGRISRHNLSIYISALKIIDQCEFLINMFQSFC